MDEERLAYTSEHAARFTTHANTHIPHAPHTHKQTTPMCRQIDMRTRRQATEAWAMAIPPCRALGRVRSAICQAIVPGDKFSLHF